MNPEPLLDEVATAIKHRCISTTLRWNVVYYQDRICCVPTYENVPPEIILCQFDSMMIRDGFSIQQWNRLASKITKFYMELHS